jgi:hypothetical protein
MLNTILNFFKYFGKGYKRYIPLVIAGAAAAGTAGNCGPDAAAAVHTDSCTS